MRYVRAGLLLLAAAGAALSQPAAPTLATAHLRALDSPNGETGGIFGIGVGPSWINMDALRDLAAGAPMENVGSMTDAGRAYAFSGADGSVLFPMQAPSPQALAQFGSAVFVGELNGDGLNDVAVGAPYENVGSNADQGRVYLYDGATGAHMQTLDTPNPQPGARFGTSLAIGDTTGDGLGEVWVGAPYENVGSNVDQGRVYLFNASNGSHMLTLNSPNPDAGGIFGIGVGPSYIDTDALRDLVVGASMENATFANQGRAYVFMSSNGYATPLPLLSPNPEQDGQFGTAVAIADATGDGLGEVWVGAPFEDVSPALNAGRVYLFSGTGGLVRTHTSPNAETGGIFGIGVGPSMLTNDGKHDVVIGASMEDVGMNMDAGRAYAYDGGNGSLLATLEAQTPQASAQFGTAVAVADVTGDGNGEAVVAAPYENVGSNADQGRVYYFCVRPWPAMSADADCDGFTGAAETSMTTDPADPCGFTPGLPAESDVWPPDVVESDSVNISDVLAMKPVFGQMPGPARYNIVADTGINIADVLALKPFFGKSCS